jgi:hypothetical protein
VLSESLLKASVSGFTPSLFSLGGSSLRHPVMSHCQTETELSFRDWLLPLVYRPHNFIEGAVRSQSAKPLM